MARSTVAPPARTARPASAPVGGTAPSDDAAERLARLQARRSPSAGPVAGVARPAAARSGRRHAAKGSRAAALTLSLATTAGLSTFFAVHAAASTGSLASAPLGTATTSLRPGGTAAPAATVAPVTVAPGTAPAAGARTPAAAAPTTAAAPKAAAAAPKVAATASPLSFTGTTVNTRFGPVQVAIATAGGQITDVQALVVPSGGKSTRINDYAAPVLRSEVLAAQGAKIDIVSGATYTSKAYAQSLQAAIDQARTAGAIVVAA